MLLSPGPLLGRPLNTDTSLLRTLSMAPLLSVLTGFDFTLKAAVLFLNRE